MAPSRAVSLGWILGTATAALAAKPGSFEDAGNTKVSAMMMFLGNSEKVYILDKAESNSEKINGHSAWGAVWDFNTHQVDLMDVKTNVFCAAGMHLPNGSYVTFGGNKAIGPGDTAADDGKDTFDSRLGDADGRKAIRRVDVCTSSDDWSTSKCQWFDDPSVLSMQRARWYAGAEPLADGSMVLIGGFTNGGYVNRNTPNVDPLFEGPGNNQPGGAEPTYEFFPANGREAQIMQFMGKTSGLNSYAHTYLMPSGKMFVQANFSTILWDYDANLETNLPDMPGKVIRVYPASGATAMLPLTPANNYNPTILFCGGTDMPDEAWGNYANPSINTWDYGASKDCQRITPEPTDGSSPQYTKDDDMPDPRTMGQFIVLPTGKMLVVNGARKGTAGYATATGQTALYGDMPFGMSLATDPTFTPAVYDPAADAGKRWSSEGFEASKIPRLYHSTAILLPDASILIAGSNPNVDVNTSTIYPTEYRAEIFYPSYFSASTRPQPSGIPKTLSYGGDPFDITIPSSSYSGSANDAADKTQIAVVRPGWTTHAMSMGQRYLQLQNTYTVNSDGSITLHTAQMPPNANIFQPGPAMVFVVVNGIPSNATFVIVGSGNMEKQTLGTAANLPNSQKKDGVSGTADGSTTGNGGNGGNGSGDSGKNGELRMSVSVSHVLGVIAIMACALASL
ncbi:hypothetical protein V5O48_011288 [Marasmius crinis-equi]|uniref:Glyoxal oxidase n=1 Tax=Marasmius crinis-equi TaxID=585013 RepID=A0ABR3F621_9AGAR